MTPLKFVFIIVLVGIVLMVGLVWIGFVFSPLLGVFNFALLAIGVYLAAQAIREEIRKESKRGNNQP